MQLEIRYWPARDLALGYGLVWPGRPHLQIELGIPIRLREVTEIPLSMGVWVTVTKERPRIFVSLTSPIDTTSHDALESFVSVVLGSAVWSQVTQLLERGKDTTCRVDYTPSSEGNEVLETLGSAAEENVLVPLPTSDEDLRIGAYLFSAALDELERVDPGKAARIIARIMADDDEDDQA